MGSISRLIALLLFGLALRAADLTGIWMGPITGKGGEKQDIAFQFKVHQGALTGVMFGDEFDLPVEDLAVSGDHVSFSVTSKNYYDGSRVKFVFSGNIEGKELKLVRERLPEPAAPPVPKDKAVPPQEITLKRLT